MDILFLLLKILAIVVFASAVGALIGWLMLKLIMRLIGEERVLKPFEFIGGVYEDLKDLSVEWLRIRKFRREFEARSREEFRKREEIIERELREALAVADAEEERKAEENAVGGSRQSKGQRP